MISCVKDFGMTMVTSVASMPSFKEAIYEQDQARERHRLNAPPQVRMPPAWEAVHAKSAQQQSLTGPRAGPPPKVGFPRAGDGLVQGSLMTASGTSSVPEGSVPPAKRAAHEPPQAVVAVHVPRLTFSRHPHEETHAAPMVHHQGPIAAAVGCC